MECEFVYSWQGKCKNEVVDGERFCAMHLGMSCISCGEQAVTDCDKAVGGLMCGSKLCGVCNCTFDHGVDT